MEINVEAPINPGLEAGGVVVGEPIRNYSQILLRAMNEGRVGFSLVSLFEASYLLEGGAIEVIVDIRNGKISRVSVHSGYRGKLFGLIEIGMRVRAAMAIDPRFYYDEAEELILCRGLSGISLEVAAVDPLPEDVPNMVIAAISAFSPAVETLAGQRGHW